MKEKSRQYTIRQIPEDVDRALRKWSAREGISLNEAAVEAMRAGSGAGGHEVRFHDLDQLAGTWVADPAFDKAQEAFEVIDKDLWA
jgi:plasmid stability protein